MVSNPGLQEDRRDTKLRNLILFCQIRLFEPAAGVLLNYFRSLVFVKFPGTFHSAFFEGVFYIVLMGAKKKMAWVHAVSNITSVTYKETKWNWTVVCFIRKSVGTFSNAINPCLTVAFVSLGSRPNPAVSVANTLFGEITSRVTHSRRIA